MAKHSKHSKHFKDNKKDKLENKKKTEKNHKKQTSQIINVQNILLAIFIIIFIISVFILVRWYINTGESIKTYDDLAEQVISVDATEDSNSNANPIDFEKLKSINSDVVAWIKIEGTTINYPVMKTTDNDYYLKKDFYKEYDNCGSIFQDYRSNFTDKNIVVYGHNIKRGIMFSDLENIANGKLGNNVNIEIYLPDRMMKFKVFSSYYSEPEDYAINTAVNENELNTFKQTIKQRSEKEFESDYNNSNQIITLSTCDRTGKKRVLVHGALSEISFFAEN